MIHKSDMAFMGYIEFRNKLKSQISNVMNSILMYLSQRQFDNGSFMGSIAPICNMDDINFDGLGNVGFTTYILWNLKKVKYVSLVKDDIVKKCENYILEKAEVRNQCSYWRWAPDLEYDFDDTIINYYNLCHKGIKVNLNYFLDNNDNIHTWKPSEEVKNDIDDIVRVNSLKYYAGYDKKKYCQILDWTINKFINESVKSPYYVNSDLAILFHICMMDVSLCEINQGAEFEDKIIFYFNKDYLCKVERLYLYYGYLKYIYVKAKYSEKKIFLKKCYNFIIDCLTKCDADTFFYKGPASLPNDEQWVFGGKVLFSAYFLNFLSLMYETI